MVWTFMLIVLWLKDGTPEPHNVIIPQSVECTQEMAEDMWNILVAKHDGDDLTNEFAWACEHTQHDDAAPAPELPPGHPDITEHKAKGDEA